MNEPNKSLKNYLVLLIVVLIGFQQFPVVRLGGSFKLYELAALGLLITDFVYLFEPIFRLSYRFLPELP